MHILGMGVCHTECFKESPVSEYDAFYVLTIVLAEELYRWYFTDREHWGCAICPPWLSHSCTQSWCSVSQSLLWMKEFAFNSVAYTKLYKDYVILE